MKIKKVIIYGDSSGIEYTNLSPAKLELYVFLPEKIKVRDIFKVKVFLKNVGDNYIKNVNVSAKTSYNLRIINKSSINVAELKKYANTNITFELEALEEGEYNITIVAFARRSLNTPSAIIEGKISPNIGFRSSLGMVGIIFLILITILSILYVQNSLKRK